MKKCFLLILLVIGMNGAMPVAHPMKKLLGELGKFLADPGIGRVVVNVIADKVEEESFKRRIRFISIDPKCQEQLERTYAIWVLAYLDIDSNLCVHDEK